MSVLDDASFVRQIRALYPGLPVFANLRCGLWYVESPTGTCYFKSTDGHTGQWSFSTVRLNIHVAEAATAAGGCIIVDATRRGKCFPDSMSKTIPQWAAVMNRAVGQLRGAAAKRSEEVHLPPWVPQTEQQQIDQRLEQWTDELLQARRRAAISPRVRRPCCADGRSAGMRGPRSGPAPSHGTADCRFKSGFCCAGRSRSFDPGCPGPQATALPVAVPGVSDLGGHRSGRAQHALHASHPGVCLPAQRPPAPLPRPR